MAKLSTGTKWTKMSQMCVSYDAHVISIDAIIALPVGITILPVAGLQVYLSFERTCVLLSHYFGWTKKVWLDIYLLWFKFVIGLMYYFFDWFQFYLPLF